MEYGTQICIDCDDNFIKHVGYSESNPGIKEYFSMKTVDTIYYKITELLQGVDPNNRPIIVPRKTICNIMSDVYNSFRPETGDIYSRYIVPSGISTPSYIQSMIDQVIEIITSDVRNNLGMEQYNKTLSAWTTVLGYFNSNSIRSVPPIKVRNRRPNPMEFNMNY